MLITRTHQTRGSYNSDFQHNSSIPIHLLVSKSWPAISTQLLYTNTSVGLQVMASNFNTTPLYQYICWFPSHGQQFQHNSSIPIHLLVSKSWPAISTQLLYTNTSVGLQVMASNFNTTPLYQYICWSPSHGQQFQHNSSIPIHLLVSKSWPAMLNHTQLKKCIIH